MQGCVRAAAQTLSRRAAVLFSLASWFGCVLISVDVCGLFSNARQGTISVVCVFAILLHGCVRFVANCMKTSQTSLSCVGFVFLFAFLASVGSFQGSFEWMLVKLKFVRLSFGRRVVYLSAFVFPTRHGIWPSSNRFKTGLASVSPTVRCFVFFPSQVRVGVYKSRRNRFPRPGLSGAISVTNVVVACV